MDGASRGAEAEIADRLLLWVALSALFLDTEHDEASLACIADSIAAAGVDASEARLVLEREVAPAFYGNLLSVAGEWQGWPEDQIRTIVSGYLKSGALQRWMSRMGARLTRRLYISEWKAIAALLDRRT